MDTLRFIIADDHPLFRTALKASLTISFENCLVVEVASITELQTVLATDTSSDLILLDLHMPDAQGFSGLIHLQAHYPEIPVLVVSASESPEVMCRAIDHGAAGFLPKSSQAETISLAINAVLSGDRWLPEGIQFQTGQNSKEQKMARDIASLTPQQFRVASLLVQGLLNKQIAYELDITEATIKAHVTEIFRKLGVHSRTQAALAFSQLDVSPPDLP
ncbi:MULTISPECIES: response regulator [Zhongshania]|jgi:DNA-binding NarL/FixJ family response regulator|uniref:DNA-binding NarL/FixJ family response regulator n=1 Tax=Zhongshania antarctica TaxID=641702 RepID=A0A840R6G1_9GAMM|nr:MULTISPECIES: response regulator transcription factor [Zhongshania]MBB5187992.1 DNA-binding NarL/FixJ family response regulator [Zhongshania antarctica]